MDGDGWLRILNGCHTDVGLASTTDALPNVKYEGTPVEPGRMLGGGWVVTGTVVGAGLDVGGGDVDGGMEEEKDALLKAPLDVPASIEEEEEMGT
jgi:hypothetical protein